MSEKEESFEGSSNGAETSLSVTTEQFLAMKCMEKRELALSTRITPEVQKMFFTEAYEGKRFVLMALAQNTSITPEIQMMFFSEDY